MKNIYILKQFFGISFKIEIFIEAAISIRLGNKWLENLK